MHKPSDTETLLWLRAARGRKMTRSSITSIDFKSEWTASLSVLLQRNIYKKKQSNNFILEGDQRK